MNYENEIPEYALQPARAPQTIDAEAIYHTEKILYPAAKQTAVYQFEEDILVPDTKADMREILLMDASCDILPAEKRVMPKTDDLLNLTGVITLQTIYNPDTDERDPVSITSKIPYKYQWNLNPAAQAEGVFSCRVKSLEHMIINERKFRVKVTLEFSGRLFCQRELAFFDGLRDEDLEMKRDEAALVCLDLVKKDELSIDESFKPRDTDGVPEYILKQDFTVTENYRQVTTEKVVINGFLFVNLLYQTKGDEEKMPSLCQLVQRIEFTQFIPIEKEHRGKKWSAVKTDFKGKDFLVVITQDEEGSGEILFHIKGDIQTRVELYECRKRDMVVDAYHREKEFVCQFSNPQISSVADEVMSETSIREMINLPDGLKAAEAVYGNAGVLECSCVCDRGKVGISGSLLAFCLWKDQDGRYQTARLMPEFHASIDVEKTKPDNKAACSILIKNVWVTLINEKQLEFNCTLLLCGETYDEQQLVLLEHPAFMDVVRGKEYPMIMVTVRPEDTLWELAKRYHTTEAQIKMANHLDAEPEAGRRLLMMK